MGKKAAGGKKAAVKKPAVVAPGEVDAAAEALENEVDAATTAPAGVRTASKKASAAPKHEIKEEDNEDGDQVVRSLQTPTGKFVAIGNEIFNPKGQLIGTEENSNDAARKADRFNSQTPKK